MQTRTTTFRHSAATCVSCDCQQVSNGSDDWQQLMKTRMTTLCDPRVALGRDQRPALVMVPETTMSP